MELYLVRHGEAVPKEHDLLRPLSEAGVARVRRVARFLSAAQAIVVRGVWHSTKLRARQTAEIFSEALASKVPLTEIEQLEPLADVAAVADEVARANNNLMLVGHLPHLNRLASVLVASDADLEVFDFSEGAVLCLKRLGGRGPSSLGTWQVRWMVSPRLLRS